MSYAPLWKGGEPHHPRFRFNRQLCWRYLCWWAASNLDQLPGACPRFLMRLAGCLDRRPVTLVHADGTAYLHFESSGRFRAGEGRVYQFWFGPLSAAVRRIGAPFRNARGVNAHRCDFTDRETGLLYGGDGRAMNGLFDEFLESIEPTQEQQSAVAFAVDDLNRAIRGQGAPGTGTFRVN
jgi:hypothetical protein